MRPHFSSRAALGGCLLTAAALLSGCGPSTGSSTDDVPETLTGLWDLELLLPGSSNPETWTINLVERDSEIDLATCVVDYDFIGNRFVPVSADCTSDQSTGTLQPDGSFVVTVGSGEPNQVVLQGRLEGTFLQGTAQLAECSCEATVLGTRLQLHEVM